MADQNRTVLVTGATGFIGEHVVQKLVDEGFNPGLLARDQNKVAEPFRGLTFHSVDLANFDQLKEVIAQYDTIIHLAGRTGAGHIEDPINDFQINASGSLNLLKACVENKTERVITFSSREVYGVPQSPILNEQHPRNPFTPYGASLLTREVYTQVFAEQYDLNTVIFRPFNVYGPAISPRNRKGIIPFLLNMFQSDDPITITGNPNDAFDFIYMEDLTSIVMNAVRANDLDGSCVNIGSGVATSLKKLVNTIKRITGQNNLVEFKYDESSSTETIICANIDKLKQTFQYDIQFDLEKGLSETISALKGVAS